MFFNDMPKKAVAYCRVSSLSQEERETIQNQVDFVEDYCKLNNIELEHVYKDDGVTGTLPLGERPAGQELLRDAKKGKFTLLLVFKLDRLGRSTQVILNAVEKLDKMSVKVRSMTEPFDTSDASGKFLLTILAGVADLERTNILQRMTLGRIRSIKSGKWTNGLPPYGYSVDDEGHLVVNDDPIPHMDMRVSDVIRQIFDSTVQGNSLKKTADRLNAMGVPPYYVIYRPQKKKERKTNHVSKWRVDNVHRIVTNPIYKGKCVHTPKDEEPIITEAPTIVSAETWEKAQMVLKSNKKLMKGNVKRKYLLGGLIKCEHCNYSYSGAFTGKHRYYVDIGRSSWRYYKRDKPCFGRSLNCEWLDDVVWEMCLEHIRNPQLITKSISESIHDSEKIEREIALIQAKIASNAMEKQRLIELYKRGFISMEDVSNEFEKVDNEKEILNAELDKMEAKRNRETLLNQRDNVKDILEMLRKKLDTPDISFELKQTVIRIMVEKITINSLHEKTTITVHFFFGDKKSADYLKDSKFPIPLRKSAPPQDYWKLVVTIQK